MSHAYLLMYDVRSSSREFGTIVFTSRKKASRKNRHFQIFVGGRSLYRSGDRALCPRPDELARYAGNAGTTTGREKASRLAELPDVATNWPQSEPEVKSKPVTNVTMVDVAGLEPATPCLQSRCSPS